MSGSIHTVRKKWSKVRGRGAQWMEGCNGDAASGKVKCTPKGAAGWRGSDGGVRKSRGVVRTYGNSLPHISVFSVKLFPMTQNMAWFVGLMCIAGLDCFFH